MIIRLLETILIGYCVASYIGCAYVLWNSRKTPLDGNHTTGDRIVASILFLIAAPILVGDVIIKRLFI